MLGPKKKDRQWLYNRSLMSGPVEWWTSVPKRPGIRLQWEYIKHAYRVAYHYLQDWAMEGAPKKRP